MPTARDSAEGGLRAFGAYLHAQRQAARLTLRELADLANISNPYLSQLERGLHAPSVAVIRSLAEALNLSAEVLLAQAAGLERAVGVESSHKERDGIVGVEAAIRADRLLTESQKRALRVVYRSMVDGEHGNQRPGPDLIDHARG
jgi:transcriptional regulator with XRE-family HTH domain